MHYFISVDGNVFAFDDASRAHAGLTPISESEALALAAGPAPEVNYPELIAAERYKREGVGIIVNGYMIDTTRDGQALIAGAAVSAILDQAYTCNWKTGLGFVELNAAQLVLIATAVRTHVQACFDREMAMLKAVASGEFRAEMLLQGWPDQATAPVETSETPSHEEL